MNDSEYLLNQINSVICLARIIKRSGKWISWFNAMNAAYEIIMDMEKERETWGWRKIEQMK